MITTIRHSKNHCGYYVGKLLRVTTNRIGKKWVETIGWAPHQATWLNLPHTPDTYIGREIKTPAQEGKP